MVPAGTTSVALSPQWALQELVGACILCMFDFSRPDLDGNKPAKGKASKKTER